MPRQSGQRFRRVETPRSEAPCSGTPRSEAPRSEATRSEATRSETPRSETPRSEAPRSEAPRSESAHSAPPRSRGWTLSAVSVLRSTKASWLALSLMLLVLPLAFGQDAAVPDRYATIHEATDFPGADLQMVPDVTLERCQSACLRDGQCAAFTFNQQVGS